MESQIAVAAVTVNRTLDKDYPRSVCKVVHQKGQFSWVGKRNRVKDLKAFNKAKKIAQLYCHKKIKNPIGNRLYFNHRRLGKRYKTSYSVIKIKNLVFY